MIPDYFTFDYALFTIFGFIALMCFGIIFLGPVIEYTQMTGYSERAKAKFFGTVLAVFIVATSLSAYFGDRDAKSHSNKPTANAKG